MSADQTAVALFKAKQIGSLAALFKAQNLLSDKLKSCKHFNKTQTIRFGDRCRHIGRYDGTDHCSVLRQTSLNCFSLAQLIFFQQAAGHISCKGVIFTRFGIFYPHTETVSIRVRSQHQISIHFLCQLQSQIKRFVCFRVRIAHGRKFSIWKFLLFYHIYIFKSQLFQHSSGRNISCTMKRGIHDLQLFGHGFDRIHMDHLTFQLFHIGIVYFFANHHIQTCFFCFCLIHGLHVIIICHFLNFSHDTAVMRRCDLRSVLPVYLITVILRRIMARSNIDTCNTSQLANSIRKLWCRTQALKNICPNAIGCQTERCLLGKLR